MPEQPIGKITHYFGKIGVGVIEIDNGVLKIGETIHLLGHGTDFTQIVESLQVNHLQVEQIGVGESAGIYLDQPVKEGVKIFKVF